MKIFKFIEEWQKISKHQSEKLTIAKEMDTHLQWRNNKDKIKKYETETYMIWTKLKLLVKKTDKIDKTPMKLIQNNRIPMWGT